MSEHGSISTLRETARDAPLESGIYIWKDAEGRIIYVGKARVLRNRLLSYFSGEKDIKTQTLLRRAASIETIITADEYEALLLENTLIKQHSPRYNINLKDGKTYPVIRLTAESFPRVFRTRRMIEDGSAYFGPFPNVGAVDEMLAIIDRTFPLRKCRNLKKRAAPCMYYHIGRCFAPCCGKIRAAEYALEVERVRKLLAGETGILIKDLAKTMEAEAAALRFEQAAALRNAIRAIEGLSGESAVVDFDPSGRDYIAWAAEGILTTFSVFSMREGKLTGRELYRAKSASGEDESVETFIAGYYNGERPPPPQIYLAAAEVTAGEVAAEPAAAYAGNQGAEQSGFSSLRQWFRTQFGYEPELINAGSERRHAAIIAMVRQNAAEDLRRRIRERGAGPALDELAAVLKLPERPDYIEGFDIAQLDGKHPVASLICFKNGVPDRKNYRRFKLRTTAGIVDDFQSMREAVTRRYSRLLREGKNLPGLVMVDGGIGQANAARGALDELGTACPVVGLAKRNEELWLPGASSPIRLSRRSEALKVLQFVRDETHRFATSLNQTLRSRDLKITTLESVEGIGPARAAKLLKTYGSIEALASEKPESIAASCGIGINAARAARAAAALAVTERKTRRPGSRTKGRALAADLAASALDEPETAEQQKTADGKE